MPITLPRLQRLTPITSQDGTPTVPFHIWFNEFADSIEGQVSGLEQVVSDLADAVAAIAAAQAAAASAQAAAETAQATAETAQATADAAVTAGSGTAAATNLALSYPDGVSITSVDNGVAADIDITAHNRVYGDGTTVALNADTLTGLTYGTKYYIYYDDPTRTGGAVTYFATTSITTAKQSGDRHTVGSITTATAGGPLTTGNRLRPPGTVGL